MAVRAVTPAEEEPEAARLTGGEESRGLLAADPVERRGESIEA